VSFGVAVVIWDFKIWQQISDFLHEGFGLAALDFQFVFGTAW
jgi:hypothetical protein